MDTIEIRATVDRSPATVFERLRDFTRYADYSRYLRSVAVDGDGGEGTDYRLRFGWWKVTYDAYTRVTGVDAPNRLDWRVTRDIDANGQWLVDPVDEGTASAVTLVVSYDPASVSGRIVDVPRLVSLDWVVEKAVGLIEDEGRRVVRRVVADLEGEPRDVELGVTRR